MTDSTQAEIQHGISLLRATHNWQGHVAVVSIDPICKWNPGGGNQACGNPVRNTVVLLREQKAQLGDPVEVIALCDHHTQCMVYAVERWRQMS